MKISYLDGLRLRLALAAGSRSLIQNAANLDAINVFPVPDGDTGTNMASTVRAMLVSATSFRPKNAGSVLAHAAQSALAAAKGNSGAILAQFISSLAEDLGQEARISAKRLAAAAVRAADQTRRALSIPREGTILTVLHDWAHAMHAKAQQSDDILHVFTSAYESAKASLARTRDILPEMRRAGVVDAGAKGFVHMLEGIAQFITSGSLRDTLRTEARVTGRGTPASAAEDGASINSVLETIDASSTVAHFELLDDVTLDAPAGQDGTIGAAPVGAAPRYCTEALVHGDTLDLDAIRSELAALGDSVVVAGNGALAKIHVHSDAPSLIFDALDARGTVEGHKVDDMRLQTLLARQSRQAKRRCAIVTDTGCDLPEDFLFEHGVLKVPALITIEGKTRPDGPSLDTRSLYHRMRERPNFSMSTSQPTDASFIRAFTLASQHADEILYIGLSSGLSGTFQAGLRSAERIETLSAPQAQRSPSAAADCKGVTHAEHSPTKGKARITTFDSKTLTSAQGLLTSRAVEMAERGMSAREIAEALAALKEKVVFFVAIKNIASLIRSGRLHGVKSLILRKFGLRPLLATNAEGKAKSAGIYTGERNTIAALFSKVKKSFRKGSRAELHIAHVDAEEDAQRLAALCRAHLHPDSKIVIAPMGPVLSSLAWLGALSVAGLPLD